MKEEEEDDDGVDLKEEGDDEDDEFWSELEFEFVSLASLKNGSRHYQIKNQSKSIKIIDEIIKRR